MVDNDIEEKQTYLRENILNKGYNAEEFMSYLNIKKGEKGLDLGNWTMEELESTVAEFIEIKNKSQKKEEPTKTKSDKKAKNKNKDKGDKNKNNLLTEEERKRNQEYMENQLNSIFEPEFIVSVLSETTPVVEKCSLFPISWMCHTSPLQKKLWG